MAIPMRRGPLPEPGHVEVQRQGEAAPPRWHCQSRQQGWYQVNSHKEPSLDRLDKKKRIYSWNSETAEVQNRDWWGRRLILLETKL